MLALLILTDIVKSYSMVSGDVEALRGVNIEFRKNEFVSVLGPSGCGKTTLLNIIGGLDRYTSGDLSVNGISTRQFRDGDWDAYRNRSIGFVFQNYNLIPHQTVLSNVELALTLSGVSKAERRRRAVQVLEKVGLGDQLKKKPNQMSGGQMQRVAIARSLVNNPEILLADEPTGALDSETSLQIMELLEEIAKDRLVIMVTHNPELAARYSTRIINLLDGEVISDSDPYKAEDVAKDSDRKSKKKPPMSFLTAVSLSLNNLMTKKTRTFMTAFAGSIGIIGIALILSLSNGFQAYIDRVQEDTLSSYPISIQEQSMDITSMMGSMMSMRTDVEKMDRDPDKVYSADIMVKILDTMMAGITTNNIADFKTYIEDPANGIKELTNDIKYGYSTQMNIYNADISDTVTQVVPNQILSNLPMAQAGSSGGMGALGSSSMLMGMSGVEVWQELVGGTDLLKLQYDVLAGRMPEEMNEIVLMVDGNNEISDYMIYSLGLKDQSEIQEIVKKLLAGEEAESIEVEPTSYTYDELLSLRFRLLLNTDYYEKTKDGWTDKSKDEDFMRTAVDNALELKVVGILRASDNSIISQDSGAIGYQSELMDYLINQINDSEIVKQQLETPEIDVFTGVEFPDENASAEPVEFDMSTLSEEQRNYMMSLSEEERAELLAKYAPPTTDATYEGNLRILGVADISQPSSISIYPKDFESKEALTDIISDYNRAAEDAGEPGNSIKYTDIVGLMMSSVSTIINTISYVLIAFVAISLVVSSIMIGIITYVSVLERTKEIGILRSIGASKKDISRVFNAETLIVGFVSGTLGIVSTLLLCIPANAIIKAITDISNVAVLPMEGGIALIIISMVLTFIAGLIPAGLAAKKDPVVALRIE